MPQFDLVTFFVEIFWFVVIFSSFYFIFLYSYVPKISKLLKLRKRRFIQTTILKLIFTKLNFNIFSSLTRKDVINFN